MMDGIAHPAGDVAQARLLLATLWDHVEETSRKIEAAENRIERLQSSPHVRHHRNRAAELRHELYQAHRMIDRLNHRFPHAGLDKQTDEG